MTFIKITVDHPINLAMGNMFFMTSEQVLEHCYFCLHAENIIKHIHRNTQKLAVIS